MRPAFFACVLAGAVSVALADEPNKAPVASPPAAAATPAAPSTPATPAPAASSPAAANAPNDEQLDKHFRSEGYTVQTRNGEKQYCKRKEETGSRLSGGIVCMNGQELLMRERKDQEDLDKAQRIMGHPQG